MLLPNVSPVGNPTFVLSKYMLICLLGDGGSNHESKIMQQSLQAFLEFYSTR